MINFARSGNVTDIAAVICHEVSHSLLNPIKYEETKQEQIIYSVQCSYMAFLESVGVRYSNDYETHAKSQSSIRDPEMMYRTSFEKILTEWLKRFPVRKSR